MHTLKVGNGTLSTTNEHSFYNSLHLSRARTYNPHMSPLPQPARMLYMLDSKLLSVDQTIAD